MRSSMKSDCWSFPLFLHQRLQTGVFGLLHHLWESILALAILQIHQSWFLYSAIDDDHSKWRCRIHMQVGRWSFWVSTSWVLCSSYTLQFSGDITKSDLDAWGSEMPKWVQRPCFQVKERQEQRIRRPELPIDLLKLALWWGWVCCSCTHSNRLV